MAFKFDFSFEEDLDNLTLQNGEDTSIPASASTPKLSVPLGNLEDGISHLQLKEANEASNNVQEEGSTGQFAELTMDELLDHLPPALSYSSITVPFTSQGLPTSSSTSVLRRDLFDARFQLLNEEDDSDDDGSAYGNSVPRHDASGFSKGDSDLIKGVYEGGLKTWEASLDLVDCLHEQGYKEGGKSIRGKRLLEVGCGTALPSLYLLETLFKELLTEERDAQNGTTSSEKTVIHLQDYNPEVLLYITFCNVVLAFWNAQQSTSIPASSDPASLPSSHPGSKSKQKTKNKVLDSENVQYSLDQDPETEIDELELSPELLESFTSFLEKHNIEIKLFAGGWEKFPTPTEGYDIILTSETVYQLENLSNLTDLLQRCAKQGEEEKEGQTTLVACKRVYFGVGGGEVAFKDAVMQKKKEAEVENVWNSKRGVETTVMRVQW